MNSYRILTEFLPHPATMRVSGPDEMQHAHVGIDGSFSFSDNNLGRFSGSAGTGKYRQSRPNEINHLRGGSYRREYQPLRPVRQSRNHGRKAVNPYSNIAESGPALARPFAPQFQRKGAL
jgi:hypothetical protein